MQQRYLLLQRYVAGLAPTLLGAAVTEAAGSMWPLALGGAATLICTVDVVRRIRAKARAVRIR